MSKTLSWKDSVTRTGYTEIDGVKVMQHTCTIDADNPKNMSLNSVKINKDAYKANREQCRADVAEFEDAAYTLQDSYVSAQEEK